MRRKEAERIQARSLRSLGWSLRRIAVELNVSISSVSTWVRDHPAPEPPEVTDEGGKPAVWTTSGERKRCGRCGLTLPIEEFNRHPTKGTQHWCRACYAAYFRARGDLHRKQSAAAKRRRRALGRRFIDVYLATHSCVDCAEDDRIVLEFDHVRAKRANVSALLVAGWSIVRLQREIELCEVVCVNCHRRRTASRGSSWRADPSRLDSSDRLLPAQRRNMRVVRDTLRAAACIDCGIRDLLVLEFDHIGVKRRGVGVLARRGVGLKTLEDEISRCQIRCANCHRRRTRQLGRRAVRAT